MSATDPQPDSGGALDARQRRWVESAIPRVRALARRLSRDVLHLSVDELESAGYEGLVQAALRYDPQTGVPFVAFAHYRARGAMLDAARRVEPSLRKRKRAMRALEATQTLLEQAERGQPRPDQPDPRSLRERVDAAAEIVAQATMAVTLSRLASRDPDTVQHDDDPESRLLAHDDSRTIREELERLEPQDRDLVEAIHLRGMSMVEYAESVGRNKSSVSRRHQRVMGLLAKRLRRRWSGHAWPSSVNGRDPPDS